jgi:hypothetical protein
MMASANFVSGRARCASIGCARRTEKVSGFGRRTLGGYPTMWRCTSVHSSIGGCQVPVSHPPTHQGRHRIPRECGGHLGKRKASSSELEHRGARATILVMAGRTPSLAATFGWLHSSQARGPRTEWLRTGSCAWQQVQAASSPEFVERGDTTRRLGVSNLDARSRAEAALLVLWSRVHRAGKRE